MIQRVMKYRVYVYVYEREGRAPMVLGYLTHQTSGACVHDVTAGRRNAGALRDLDLPEAEALSDRCQLLSDVHDGHFFDSDINPLTKMSCFAILILTVVSSS